MAEFEMIIYCTNLIISHNLAFNGECFTEAVEIHGLSW
jgi:hypothetical protein